MGVPWSRITACAASLLQQAQRFQQQYISSRTSTLSTICTFEHVLCFERP
jgi:hypothetical protein